MEKIIRKAYAKINLGLDVVGRRADGYHLLRMVMQQIDLCDGLELTVKKREGACRIEVADLPGAPVLGEENLAVRAIRLMMEAYGIRADLELALDKRIPLAAGLAGGSADAAAAFKAMRDLFRPDLPDEALMELAVGLGADIPYCIVGGTMLAEGIGERLTPLPPMPDCAILLVMPDGSASTAQVYRALDALPSYPHPDIDGQIAALRKKDLPNLCEKCDNVLELITGGELPVIGSIESFMTGQGALASRMSGSGPCVFSVFVTEEEAKKARGAFLRTNMAVGCRTYLCRPVN